MLLTVIVALPVFASVAVRVAATPVCWLPNAMLPVSDAIGATATPLPVSCTFCVLPAVLPELSVNVMNAVREPGAPGVNATPTVQEAPCASDVPQTVPVVGATRAKSPALAPVGAMLAMFSVALPVFDSVMFCVALAPAPTLRAANVSDAGLTPATGWLARAVPVSATSWLVPATPLWLSVKRSSPVRVPAAPACGVNCTMTVHASLVASVIGSAPQVPPAGARRKSLAIVPLTPSAVMDSGCWPPWLVIVTVCDGPVVLPISVEPNVSDVGDSTPLGTIDSV